MLSRRCPRKCKCVKITNKRRKRVFTKRLTETPRWIDENY